MHAISSALPKCVSRKDILASAHRIHRIFVHALGLRRDEERRLLEVASKRALRDTLVAHLVSRELSELGEELHPHKSLAFQRGKGRWLEAGAYGGVVRACTCETPVLSKPRRSSLSSI